jgi:predicted DNA-binding protein
MEKQIVTLHIRVTEKTAAALKRLAEADHRKVAGYISALLERHVAETEKPEKPAKGGRGK